MGFDNVYIFWEDYGVVYLDYLRAVRFRLADLLHMINRCWTNCTSVYLKIFQQSTYHNIDFPVPAVHNRQQVWSICWGNVSDLPPPLTHKNEFSVLIQSPNALLSRSHDPVVSSCLARAALCSLDGLRTPSDSHLTIRCLFVFSRASLISSLMFAKMSKFSDERYLQTISSCRQCWKTDGDITGSQVRLLTPG